MTQHRRPEQRRKEILEAALTLARQIGYTNVTRHMVAEQCQCSTGAINAHYGTMKKLRHRIMRAAIERSDLKIIAQGLAAGDRLAQSASEKLKEAAIQELL